MKFAIASRKLIPIAILLIFFSFVWVPLAQAATRFEEQVLQIIREHPEVLVESVQKYQQQQQAELQQARQGFLEALQTNPQQIIGNSPIAGNPTSKILLVEFSDFQCPYCAQANKTLKKLQAKYPDKFSLVYKHFPLTDAHPQAMASAQAAWAAQQQGKFWEYQDALFANQKILGEELYTSIAKNLNLDLDKFTQDRAIASNNIQKDVVLATQLGVSGTPFFVMNSEAYSGGIELSKLEKIISDS
jgi:protein-disulfide isomerase